jgi:hypothetical protein
MFVRCTRLRRVSFFRDVNWCTDCTGRFRVFLAEFTGPYGIMVTLNRCGRSRVLRFEVSGEDAPLTAISKSPMKRLRWAQPHRGGGL